MTRAEKCSPCPYRRLERVQERSEAGVHAEFPLDAQEPLAQQGHGRGRVELAGDHVVDGKEDVGDLGILLVPFSGGGDHHAASARVRLDDFGHLAELGGVGEGGAPELADDGHRILRSCSRR
jgi:hypothetical protein